MTDHLVEARQVTNRLAQEIPYEAAVAWVHTGAMAQHAVGLGLIDRRGSIADTIEVLADAHPALAGLADPAVNRAWTAPTPDLDPVEDLWARHSVADSPERPDGYPLGELYQALSDESRKGRALCQTPQFVTELLWDLAALPAIAECGAETVRLIDPSCGTGHILVEAFIRLRARMPYTLPPRERIERALAGVHGVDLDPYAAAIARYRLLALYCQIGGRRLPASEAPQDLPVNVAAADSLLAEDEPLLARGRYHVVLANPPYITVKDAQVNEAVRRRYPEVCHRQYSLALPFFALMNELLVPGGWCAQITANSFMKREFGKKFVEEYLPRYDLRWAIDTSGAYIPGHGTPTVILVHRNQPPIGETVSVVQGVRGEPSAPEDPARGLVWAAIASQVRERLAFQRLASAVPDESSAPPQAGERTGEAGQLSLFDLPAAA